MSLPKTRTLLLPLLVLWAGVYLGRLEEAQLKMDAMCYSAIAKYILQDGDWINLRYWEGYRDYFQHPHLPFWLQALSFKVFGISDGTARLMPSFFALLTLLCTFWWGKLVRDRWTGLYAFLILLTSTRYIKYSSDFQIDGILAFWTVLGSVSILLIERTRKYRWAFLFGVCTAAALLSKGVVGLSLPFSAFIYALLSASKKTITLHWLSSIGIAFLIFAPWLFFMNGTEFIPKYLNTFGNRAQAEYFSEHFIPLMNLVKTYWPWFGLLIWGLFKRTKNEPFLSYFQGPVGLAIIHSAVIFGAFSYIGFFYEHYFCTLYPLLGVICASAIPSPSPSAQKKILLGVNGLCVALILIIFFKPGRLRTERTESVRVAAKYVSENCQLDGIDSAHVSENISGKWLGLAAFAWRTPWDITMIKAAPEPKTGSILVFPDKNDSVISKGWEPTVVNPNFTVYEAKGAKNCN